MVEFSRVALALQVPAQSSDRHGGEPCL